MTAHAGDLIGLDIGGTSLKAVRVGADGRVIATVTVPAGGLMAREDLLGLIGKTVADLARGDSIARIGAAIGGAVGPGGVMPADATNLPNLAGVPLPPLLRERLGRPCSVINDAQAAMHGEAWVGAARGASDVLMVTFGTGIGAGLVLGGKSRSGPHGTAGELGASPILGAAGVTTLEEIAAPVRFERRVGRRLGARGFERGLDGETDAALDAIGRALAGAHLLLDLDVIVLGGAIASSGEPFRAAIEAAFRRALAASFRSGVSIVLGTLGPYAGAIGAVAPAVPEPPA